MASEDREKLAFDEIIAVRAPAVWKAVEQTPGLTRRMFLCWALLSGAAGLRYRPKEAAALLGVSPDHVSDYARQAERAADEITDPPRWRRIDFEQAQARVHASLELFSLDPSRDLDALGAIVATKLGLPPPRRPTGIAGEKRRRTVGRLRKEISRTRVEPALPPRAWLEAQPPVSPAVVPSHFAAAGAEELRDPDAVVARLDANSASRQLETDTEAFAWLIGVAAAAMARPRRDALDPLLEAQILEVLARHGRNAERMATEYLARRVTALVGRDHPLSIASWSHATHVLRARGHQSLAMSVIQTNLDALSRAQLDASDLANHHAGERCAKVSLLTDSLLAGASDADLIVRRGERLLDQAMLWVDTNPGAAAHEGLIRRRRTELRLARALRFAEGTGRRIGKPNLRPLERDLDEGREFNLTRTGGSWPMGWLLAEARASLIARDAERFVVSMRRFADLFQAEPVYPNYPPQFEALLREAMRRKLDVSSLPRHLVLPGVFTVLPSTPVRRTWLR